MGRRPLVYRPLQRKTLDTFSSFDTCSMFPWEGKMRASASRAERSASTANDPRWGEVVARNAQADGRFFYSVTTTGVYCRPSCPARLARLENIRFHTTAKDAEDAGFRPCQRCKPDQASLAERHAASVTAACRVIESSERLPRLMDLARQVGISTYHFHRVFKQITGLTPRAYAVAHRNQRMRDRLAGSGTITEAIFDAGYNSSGRFYAKAKEVLGMHTGNYRAGGENEEIRFAVGECSLGAILIACSECGVCAILMGDDAEELVHDLQNRFARATLIGGDAKFEQVVATVVAFVEAPRLGLALPLDVRGTAFQQRVWNALREVPAGVTLSYSELASRIGAPESVRAVAGACAANALAVAIPCHRVVRRDGSLSGYRWGVARKRALLDREGRK